MKHSAESIKGEAALLLAHLIYYIPNTEKKYQAFDELKENFALSPSQN
jgi:hypothetical protein